MPDHVDFVEVEEVVDGLDVGELPAELEVDDKVESHYQQGVAEEPENLENGLLLCVSWIQGSVISFLRETCAENGPEWKHEEINDSLLLANPCQFFHGIAQVFHWLGILPLRQYREEKPKKKNREKNEVEDDGVESKNHENKAEGHDTEDCEENVEWEASR